MQRSRSWRTAPLLAACTAWLALVGCNLSVNDQSVLVQDQTQIEAAVNQVQVQDPRTAALPPDVTTQGDVVVLDPQVVFVDSVPQDLVVTELPDITLLGIENQTTNDIFVRYEADGQEQGVFVYDGETLLLKYPCLTTLSLLSEDDFDTSSGVLVDTFDLTGIDYTNPADFICGDAFIVTLDPNNVIGQFHAIDLQPQ